MTTNLYALIEVRPGHPNLGQPFYVGIGTAKRPYRHLAQSRTTKGHRNLRLHEILVSHRALGFVPDDAIGTDQPVGQFAAGFGRIWGGSRGGRLGKGSLVRHGDLRFWRERCFDGSVPKHGCS